jgi:hypothetical protein
MGNVTIPETVCPVCYHHSVITHADVSWLFRQIENTTDPNRMRRIAFALHDGLRESVRADGAA